MLGRLADFYSDLSPGVQRALRWALWCGLMVILVRGFSETLWTAWEDLQQHHIALSWHLVAAWIGLALSVKISGAIWGKMLSEMHGRPIDMLSALSAHCVAWLLKYVPGQIGSLAYKIRWAQSHGISKTHVTMSFLYENVFEHITPILPALAILAVYSDQTFHAGNWTVHILIMSAALAGLALVSLKPALRFLLRKLAERHGFPLREPLGHGAGLRYSALFLLPRFFNALSFALIVAAITPISGTDWVAVGAIYVIASAIGAMAVLVPDGLGVRESVIMALAAPIIGSSEAVFAAVLMRLVATASDALPALLGLARWHTEMAAEAGRVEA
jgi:uncharacterized membrane protein YbhN (UPF0104 family)